MKKIVFFLIMLVTNQLFAQGNLQFNRVITYGGCLRCDNDTLGHLIYDSPTWTVPSNKVWKIESKSMPAGLTYLYINGVKLLDEVTVSGGYGASGVAFRNSPIWLKAGDQIFFRENLGSYGNDQYFISILEFNIVP